ncbi:hypothetical protein ACFOGI_02700 [Virgibacillus xinjiangensis]|uniref:RNA polymerase subunit sigma-70 n=1 Tax=Virgibacillus xinjiangensis TaxID=393090 RepID=A0ABV7CRZ0_9BACI
MRMNEKHGITINATDVTGINFHRFMELESHATHMEIAEELGISLGEVQRLKKKVNRA